MSGIILYAILSTPDDIYTFLLFNVAASCYLHAILIYSIHAFWSAFVFLAVLFSSVRKFLGQFFHRFERGGWRYSANHGHLIGAYRWELCRSLATTCHVMIDAKIMAQLTRNFVTVFLKNLSIAFFEMKFLYWQQTNCWHELVRCCTISSSSWLRQGPFVKDRKHNGILLPAQ